MKQTKKTMIVSLMARSSVFRAMRTRNPSAKPAEFQAALAKADAHRDIAGEQLDLMASNEQFAIYNFGIALHLIEQAKAQEDGSERRFVIHRLMKNFCEGGEKHFALAMKAHAEAMAGYRRTDVAYAAASALDDAPAPAAEVPVTAEEATPEPTAP